MHDNIPSEVLIINKADEIMLNEVHTVIQANESMIKSPSQQNFLVMW